MDGDGIADIQYAATKANITKVFNILKNELTPEDNLFIYTTDHGGQASGTKVYLHLWGEVIDDNVFAAEIDKVNAGIINICMEQCHSGGFIDDLQKDNRVIATACRYDELSYAMNGLLYDEFVYHWTSAVVGSTPEGMTVNADSNNDGFVSMQEAFNYAVSMDTRPKTPQYSSKKGHLGQYLTLLGEKACTTDYINETYTNNATIRSCKINLQNVVVSNNAVVLYDVINEVVSNGTINIQNGTFSIE